MLSRLDMGVFVFIYEYEYPCTGGDNEGPALPPPGLDCLLTVLLLPRAPHSFPITLECPVCKPLFNLAGRLVVPPPARSGLPIMSSGVIGRIVELAAAAELCVDV